MSFTRPAWRSDLLLAVGALLLAASLATAQDRRECRFLCGPELKLEPTVTLTNVFRPARVVGIAGPMREERETEFEMILSLGMETRLRFLEFTLEAIVQPFDPDSTPELELEANLVWLPSERTGGWVSSHFDVVDKFSPAERPADTRAYTHKLNLELDTSLAVFRWLGEGLWLRRLELEASLDYVASGLPRAGDEIAGRRYVDDASPWSFSVVLVLPIAPF